MSMTKAEKAIELINQIEESSRREGIEEVLAAIKKYMKEGAEQSEIDGLEAAIDVIVSNF